MLGQQFDDGINGTVPMGIRRRFPGGLDDPMMTPQGPTSTPDTGGAVDNGLYTGPGIAPRQPPPDGPPGQIYPGGSGVGPREGPVGGGLGASLPAQILDTPRQIQAQPPGQVGMATPTMSQAPNPVAAATPNPEQPPPFEPMQGSMTPSDMATPDSGGITRRSISPYTPGSPTGGPGAAPNGLLGRAGGLLGGGLGVPGMGGQDQTDIGDLIAQVLMLANRR